VDALAGKVAGGDPERPGVVHRLDRDTSGLIALARSEGAHAAFSELVRQRAFERTYLALVRGRPRSRSGRIEAPIGRDRGDPTRISLDTDSPREAATNFEVEQLFPDDALLRVKLETGRMHQIRVHLAAVDLPIVGDPTYGVREAPLERQFLHATALAFPHPFTGERIETVSELPPDLATFLAALS
jgi:23S rRNA pseudouridine1911/1915/1917 synthase